MNLITELTKAEQELRQLGIAKRSMESKIKTLPRGNPFREDLLKAKVFKLYPMQVAKIERLKASIRAAVS